MGLRERLARVTAKAVASAPPAPPPDPVAAAILAAVLEVDPRQHHYGAYNDDFTKTEAGARLMASPAAELPDVAIACLREAARLRDPAWNTLNFAVRAAAWQIAGRILRRKLPWSDASLVAAFEAMLECRLILGWTPVVPALGAAERHLAGALATGSLADALTRTRGAVGDLAEGLRLKHRIDALLGTVAAAGELHRTDPWRAGLLDAVEALPEADADAARSLLACALKAGSSSKPSKAFLAARSDTVSELGAQRAGALLAALLQATARVPAKAEHGQVPPDTGDLLRGLAWTAGATAGLPAAAGLAALAVSGWRKVPGFGPQCRKAASAAVNALGEHPDGAGQLGAVKVQLKQPAARAEVDRAIDAAAASLGVSREDFEERLVPDFGLDAGARSERVGTHTARLELGARLRFELVFVTDEGRALKSVPANVKRDHAARLGELKALRKDAQQMLDAQRLRLERLLMHDPQWTLGAWQERYVDHGLLGPLARRLIWRLDDDVSVFFRDGAWRTADGAEHPVGEHAGVRLWHPAGASGEEVLAWRMALEEWQVVQPFKQAHREVYLLTDAERTTDVYSNRFAGHIVRQHQFAALARDRGWRYALQGAWDSGDEQGRLPLDAYDLEASFWVDRPWDAQDDWNDSGVFNHVLTDQVRFTTARGEDVHLSEVPPLILSEVLRDVDLFVGVASIGNDPSWQDSGGARRDTWGGYWADYSFGDLGAAAEVRRDLLQRLLPKLAIANVATLDERFLRVAGTRRTYKIHLGSGNILMEPNDQYLCIVPGRSDGAGHGVMLPFEGDGLLSIILSKAMLLAADDKITDAVITSQIGRR
jgi:hypothetical protein